MVPSHGNIGEHNPMTELDPRASDQLKHSVNYLLHHIVGSCDELMIATFNLAIQEGVSLGIDEMRAALKSGDPDHGQPTL